MAAPCGDEAERFYAMVWCDAVRTVHCGDGGAVWWNAVGLKCLLLVEVEESHGDGGTMRDRGSVRYVVGSHSSGSSSGDSDGDCPAPGLQDHTFEGESRMVADHGPVEAAAATAMETVRPLGFKITS